MSYISEINNLNISLKILAVCVFLLPFWYVAIYLFNADFYKSADTVLIVAMCLVLSLTSIFPTGVMFDNAQQEVDNHEKEPEYFFDMVITSVIVLCLWLSFMIFVIYSLRYLFNISFDFYYFVVIYFFPIVFLAIMYIAEIGLRNFILKIKNPQ